MTRIIGLVFVVMCALSLWALLLRTGLGCELDQPPGTRSSVTFEHCGAEHEVLAWGWINVLGNKGVTRDRAWLSQVGEPVRKRLVSAKTSGAHALKT